MFNNIGAKIKGLAKFIFWVISIASIIAGMYVIIQGMGGRGSSDSKIMSIVIGILTAVFGIILAWLQNFLLYGFGELVDSNQKMLRILEDRSMGPSNYAVTNVVRSEPVNEPVAPTEVPKQEPTNALKDIVK